MEMGLMSLRSSDSPVCRKSVSFAEKSPEAMEEGDEVQSKSPSPCSSGRGILKKSPLKRTEIQFPVRKLKYRMLADYTLDICEDAPVYMAGVLKYLVNEVISLAVETANSAQMSKIKPRHLQIVFQKNEELRELMIGEDKSIVSSTLDEPKISW